MGRTKEHAMQEMYEQEVDEKLLRLIEDVEQQTKEHDTRNNTSNPS